MSNELECAMLDTVMHTTKNVLEMVYGISILMNPDLQSLDVVFLSVSSTELRRLRRSGICYDSAKEFEEARLNVFKKLENGSFFYGQAFETLYYPIGIDAATIVQLASSRTSLFAPVVSVHRMLDEMNDRLQAMLTNDSASARANVEHAIRQVAIVWEEANNETTTKQ